MAAQVKCPNCGGYRVSSSSTHVDPQTRKQVHGLLGLGCFVACLSFFAGTIVVGMFYFLIVSATNHWSAYAATQQQNQNTAIWFVGGVVIAGVVFFLFYRRRQRKMATAIEVFHHECLLCGKSWDQDAGSPAPVGQVRPDLIQKGAKKLEEQAAAAWYWQQQQNDKKKR